MSAQLFSQVLDATYLPKRPLPVAPDGRYDWQANSDGFLSPERHSGATNLFNKAEAHASKPLKINAADVHAFVDQAINPSEVDDRKNVLAKGFDILSRLPQTNRIAKKLSDNAVELFYNTVPHPPATLLGTEYNHREANGRGNNIFEPSLGEAGTPYARSVQAKYCLDQTALPDAGLIFDTLLRRDKPVEHPGGNSSLTFAFAALITHSLFRTDRRDTNLNATSSYLDLSPLYGINKEAEGQIRDTSSGRGLLHPDTFSEERLIFLPPAPNALLVVLSRNHNYIAQKLLQINEHGRWTDPPPTDLQKRAEQDEELFQTAKLVNCGQFMGLVMDDYVAGFLGMAEGNAWNVPAFNLIKKRDGSVVHRGQGNHCSVEFNLLYRWHATTSAKDEKYIEESFDEKFKPLNLSSEQITFKDFVQVFTKEVITLYKTAPKDRVFGGLKRGPDGRFNDDDIAKILQDATDDPANSYGARSIPACMRALEVGGIEQARHWGVCTMNEFREFLGLKRFTTFEEWNKDPEIAEAARRLYVHIDNLELYPGLQCEELMGLSYGLRFAAGYTMTRAVLGDAIALVRGDRFATASFSPAHLTTWGFQDCQRDPLNGGGGGQLPKLLSRHLPRHYPFFSVYTCFPLFTPKTMEASLTKQGIADKYKPPGPANLPIATRLPPRQLPKVIHTFKAINTVFSDPARFKVVYQLSALGDGYGFMMGFDDPKKHDPDRALAFHALLPSKTALDEYRIWYRDQTIKRIEENSWSYHNIPGTCIDVVNDVINATAVHWATDRLCGLPVKTKENPTGIFTVQEVYDMLSVIFDLTILGIFDNEHGFARREKTTRARDILEGVVTQSFYRAAPRTVPETEKFQSRVMGTFLPKDPQPCDPFLRRLADTGRKVNELVATVIGFAVGQSVNYAQAAVQVVDFYLDKERDEERNVIVELAQRDDDASIELLRGYTREAMRLNPQFTGLWRASAVAITIEQGSGRPPVQLQPRDLIWGSFRNAHLNPDDFPHPTVVDPTRPASSYNLNGAGFHCCVGADSSVQTIAEILKVLFKLKNLRRAPGNAGKLAKFKEVIDETETVRYIRPDGKISNWPGSMILMYDEVGTRPQRPVPDVNNTTSLPILDKAQEYLPNSAQEYLPHLRAAFQTGVSVFGVLTAVARALRETRGRAKA
ncbi:heme peroxidase [Pluteus cervinus]|uniref:Heme peroxidase n=1 Tax=Pluteus cervinus TaxID=181527 RepID=A0ACD3A666_9AGAR|nr:heme peroxidase [Pluteus cervinus]